MVYIDFKVPATTFKQDMTQNIPKITKKEQKSIIIIAFLSNQIPQETHLPLLLG